MQYLGYWGATGQKSSIRKMSSDFPRRRRSDRQMVIFDMVPRDFKVVKQSAIRGNTEEWQSNFSRSSNVAPMAALMGNRQPINWRATFTLMIRIGRSSRSTAEITTVWDSRCSCARRDFSALFLKIFLILPTAL